MEQLTDNQFVTREQDKERLKNEKWILHIREYIDDCCGLEKAMKQYVKWVENGGGDEWFKKED